MSKRPLIYLGIAVIVAVVIIIIDDPFSHRVDDTSSDYFIPDFDIANIEHFQVEQLIDGSLIRRGDGDKWEVSEEITDVKKRLLEKEGREIPPTEWKGADITRVLSALGSFGGLSKGVLVSSNPKRRHAYQVGPAGLHVTAFDKDDKMVLDVIIGKGGPDFMSTYVRPFDTDDVYLVNRNLTGIFSPRFSDWLKREPQRIKEEAKKEPK